MEVYVHHKKERIKMEEWSFITHKTLMKSVNYEDDESDPELDNIYDNSANFFIILKTLLKNITPKVFIKLIKPHTIEFVLTKS